MFRPILALAALLALALTTSPAAARPQIIEADRIVAIVGSEAITLFELKTQLQQVVGRLQRQGTPLPPEATLERQMLERMIMERAQIQAAREQGLRVEDAQLEQTIARIAANNKMSDAQFRAALEKDGIAYAQFREEIRGELLIARLREREVDSRLVISDAEIDNFLAQTDGKREELHVAHILLRAPEAASPEQLQKLRSKAEDVARRAQQGENFAELAAAYSDAPDALQGGDLGWRSEDTLPTLFAETAKTLQPSPQPAAAKVGDIALLQSPNGFHVIKLIARRGNQTEDDGVRQTRARHILIRVDELISESEARRRLEDLRERLRHGENFAELARLYSQDGSAANGGDLGWINPGDTVPEFERAMDALSDGEISAVVQSPFGFHVIKVEERRVQNMSVEKQRLAARQILRERKMDEAYQDWLRQLRDRTYVEYRLEDE
ncbi:MAG: peptidylprolyl isomerase [Zoogloeaceae bacterium]|jgi:peptidyl-prolyl cis-trans isomerase SurA|nr:peptidylprolyl isomerase [Zoogloeaceae bacterium]